MAGVRTRNWSRLGSSPGIPGPVPAPVVVPRSVWPEAMKLTGVALPRGSLGSTSVMKGVQVTLAQKVFAPWKTPPEAAQAAAWMLPLQVPSGLQQAPGWGQAAEAQLRAPLNVPPLPAQAVWLAREHVPSFAQQAPVGEEL